MDLVQFLVLFVLVVSMSMMVPMMSMMPMMMMVMMVVTHHLVDDDFLIHHDVVAMVLPMITLLCAFVEVHTASAPELDSEVFPVAFGSALVSVDLSVGGTDTFELGVVSAAHFAFSDFAFVFAHLRVHVVAHEEFVDVHEAAFGLAVVEDDGSVFDAGASEERVVDASGEAGLDSVHVLGSEEVPSPGPSWVGGLSFNILRLVDDWDWCGDRGRDGLRSWNWLVHDDLFFDDLRLRNRDLDVVMVSLDGRSVMMVHW